MMFRFTKTAALVAMGASTLLSGCASSPFDAQNVQRLLTHEEKAILAKTYEESPCNDAVYSPLLLSIQDRHGQPQKSKGSMCDLVKSIRWVDSSACFANANRTTIEEEFKRFHGVSLQEACYQNTSQITAMDPTKGTLSLQSKYDLIDTMNAAAECEAVRYSLIELTSHSPIGTQEYQKVSALIDLCLNKKKTTQRR